MNTGCCNSRTLHVRKEGRSEEHEGERGREGGTVEISLAEKEGRKAKFLMLSTWEKVRCANVISHP